MKLDYKFLKDVMETLVENESHLMSNTQIAKALNINLDDDVQFDKWAGHIKVLGDNFCIDCANSNFGFSHSFSGWTYFEIEYRLTSHGYEFLDMLRQKNVFNKIKDFSLSTAYEVGKALLINELSGALK